MMGNSPRRGTERRERPHPDPLPEGEGSWNAQIMATITEVLARPTYGASGIWSWITTVDHKRIGVMYGVTAFIFMLLSGIEAGVIRTQLATPDTDLIGPSRYNQMFTMHATVMIFMVIMPMSVAFFNFVVPLAIGAPRRGLSPAERAVLLDIPVRRHPDALQLHR